MAAKPLTHHEILRLVEPFSARGRHVDLAATDRQERRLVFKAIDHPGGGSAQPALRETLILDCARAGRYQLIRTLIDEGGLSATLEAVGDDPGELLTRIDGFAPAAQFKIAAGTLIAFSYQLGSAGARDHKGLYPLRIRSWLHERWRALIGTRRGADQPGVAPAPSGPGAASRRQTEEPPASAASKRRFTRAAAKLADLALCVEAASQFDKLASVELAPQSGSKLELPADLLAVVGWDWPPLELLRGKWRGRMRLAKTEPARTLDAEEKVAKTVVHLVHTLAEPPVDFHPRFRRARWRVAFQRGLPLLVAVGLVVAAPAVQWLPVSEGSVIKMLIFHSPPLLLIAYFAFDLPRLEIPSFPRPLQQTAWHRASQEQEEQRAVPQQ